jgi:aspartyl protease family protein
MRAYVFFFCAFGLCGVAAQHLTPSTSPLPPPVQQSVDEEQNEIAELKRKNEPKLSVTDGSVQLQRDPDGHFYADVQINGTNVHMMIDTGASEIALSRQDAQAAGIATSIGMNDVVGEGADGPVHGEYVRVERIELGPLSATGMDAVILNSGTQSLLGQSFLSKFGSVNIDEDTMVLRQSS